jgi:tetratricopeptide (TPR) repeat protein
VTADATHRGALARAETLLGLGRPAEARAHVVDVLAVDPRNATALRQLARCQAAIGELDDALTTARRAIAAEPESEHGHRVLSHVLLKRRDFPAAVTAAQQALRLAPDNWRGHLSLVEALRRIDGPSAYEAAGRLVELAPHEPDAHIAYGSAAAAGGDRATARQSFERALTLDPNNATARNNLAVLDMREKAWRRALAGFRASQRMDPTQQLARTNLDRLIRIVTGLLADGMLVTGLPVILVRTGISRFGYMMAGLGLLALWAVLVGWAVLVLRPAGRYALAVLRRERRLRVQLAIAALTVLADLFGPILGLIPRTVQLGTVGVGYLGMLALAVTAAVYSRRRSR